MSRESPFNSFVSTENVSTMPILGIFSRFSMYLDNDGKLLISLRTLKFAVFYNKLAIKPINSNRYLLHNTRYISNIRYCPKEQWSKIISQKIIILVLNFRGEIVFLKKIALFLNSVV